MPIKELAPAISRTPGGPTPPSIDDRLESLRHDVCQGHPRSWFARLNAIRKEAAAGGLVWESRHEALFRAIAQRGVLNDLEDVETAPDPSSAERRLKMLESHARFHGVTVLSRKIEELKRQNQFALAGDDLKEGGSRALESLQDAGSRKWSGGYANAGEAVDKIADSAGHLFRGAAMTLGIFE